jgi:hypothetical protein
MLVIPRVASDSTDAPNGSTTRNQTLGTLGSYIIRRVQPPVSFSWTAPIV